MPYVPKESEGKGNNRQKLCLRGSGATPGGGQGSPTTVHSKPVTLEIAWEGEQERNKQMHAGITGVNAGKH